MASNARDASLSVSQAGQVVSHIRETLVREVSLNPQNRPLALPIFLAALRLLCMPSGRKIIILELEGILF